MIILLTVFFLDPVNLLVFGGSEGDALLDWGLDCSCTDFLLLGEADRRLWCVHLRPRLNFGLGVVTRQTIFERLGLGLDHR